MNILNYHTKQRWNISFLCFGSSSRVIISFVIFNKTKISFWRSGVECLDFLLTRSDEKDYEKAGKLFLLVTVEISTGQVSFELLFCCCERSSVRTEWQIVRAESPPVPAIWPPGWLEAEDGASHWLVDPAHLSSPLQSGSLMEPVLSWRPLRSR